MTDNPSSPEPQPNLSNPNNAKPSNLGRTIAIAAAVPLMMLLCAGLCIAGGGVTIFRGILDQLSPSNRATVSATQTIVVRIQTLGQLVSISSQLAKADIFVGIEQSAANMCGFSANHVAQGAVEAGIDLTLMNDEDATFDPATNTYSLTLPAAQLTSCRLDYIRQYDRSTTLCAVDWDEARLLANYAALVGFREDAIEGGILTAAEQQARVVLTSFIGGLTGANVVINFSPNSTLSIPSSCQPDIPVGWNYNEAENTWTRQD